MKTIIYSLVLLLAVMACKKKVLDDNSNDNAIVSVLVKNKQSDSIYIGSYNIGSKTVSLNPDGSFNDTIKVDDKGDIITMGYEENYIHIYLKKGYNSKVEFDADNLSKTLEFSGDGSENNSFIAIKNIIESEMTSMYNNSDTLSIEGFTDILNVRRGKFDFIKKNIKGLDPAFITMTDSLDKLQDNYYINEHETKQFLNNIIGKPSPKFEAYENYEGGTTSLEDLKDKFVFIDVWATWCGPCKAEIPFLKELENKYHNKNIEFVSISVDNLSAYEKWRAMIKNQNLGGVQLIANNSFKSNFIKEYKINAIPRFIFIDPDGNIISANAPRPSNKKLIELFNKAGV